MDAVAEKAAASEDTLAAQVRAAQAELQDGIDRAGLRDDPFRHPLQALSTVMGLFPALAGEMASAIERARQPIDPAALERLEAAAAGGAAAWAAELARAHNLRTVLIASAALVGALVVGAGGGYWFGRSTQAVAVTATEAGVVAAFRDGRDAAATWLGFMRANDGAATRAECAKSTKTTPSGRRACWIGLWVDPPQNPGTGMVPAG